MNDVNKAKAKLQPTLHALLDTPTAAWQPHLFPVVLMCSQVAAVDLLRDIMASPLARKHALGDAIVAAVEAGNARVVQVLLDIAGSATPKLDVTVSTHRDMHKAVSCAVPVFLTHLHNCVVGHA